MEFGDSYCILGIIGVGDEKEMIDSLINALKDIAQKYQTGKKFSITLNFCNPQVIISPRDAFYAKKLTVPLAESVGNISGESAMAYPPGIPIISPGELISQDIINHIYFFQNQNTTVTGLCDSTLETIKILQLPLY